MSASGPRPALQLYTIRNARLELSELAESIAAAGYAGVETADLTGIEVAHLRQLLDASGLEVASAHVALGRFRSQFDEVVRYHTELGTPLLVVPWLDQSERPTAADGWLRLGNELGALARRVAASGMRLGYHNHDFELQAYDARTGLELLSEAGHDGGLGIELDLGWVAAVGLSPLAVFESLGERVVSLHAKDVAALGTRSWEDVGHGVLDWPPLVALARARALPWLIVEHDDPADPVASMRRSAQTMRELLAS